MQFSLCLILFFAIWLPLAFDWYDYSKIPHLSENAKNELDTSQIRSVYISQNGYTIPSDMLIDDAAVKNALAVYKNVVELVPKSFWCHTDSSNTLNFSFIDKNGRSHDRHFDYKALGDNPELRAALAKYYATASYIDAHFSLLGPDLQKSNLGIPESIVITNHTKSMVLNDQDKITTLLTAMRKDYAENSLLLNEPYIPVITLFDASKTKCAELYGYNTRALEIFKSFEDSAPFLPDAKVIATIKLLPLVKSPIYDANTPIKDQNFFNSNDFWTEQVPNDDLITLKDYDAITRFLKQPRTYTPLSQDDMLVKIFYKDGTEEISYTTKITVDIP